MDDNIYFEVNINVAGKQTHLISVSNDQDTNKPQMVVTTFDKKYTAHILDEHTVVIPLTEYSVARLLWALACINTMKEE